MGLFDDFSRFFESRLDEFLRDHPHLELQALDEQLREQEKDTLRLLIDLQHQETKLQEEILSLAKDIQTWHSRISKAKSAGREDLAKAAQEREESLLRLGNQRWGQMQGVKQRIVNAKELLQQTQQKREEVQAEAARVKTEQAKAQNTPSSESYGWNQGYTNSNTDNYSRAADPLDGQFQRWELDKELEEMKRNLGK
ncbi:MAG: TIGR04376 family protein [Spirulinaceae cyanobacterium]